MKPNTQTALATAPQKPSALNVMATRYNVDGNKLLDTLKGTVFKGANNEQLMALVIVANEYKLNPFTKQIYAFPGKGGEIVPVVGVDGWIALVNSQPTFDGIDFEFHDNEDGSPNSVTCRIDVKGRSKPVAVTEYFEECARNTDPWKQMPRRMLRHKALIQCARVAFGLTGIMDDDEAKDIVASLPEPSIPVESRVVKDEPKPSTFSAREQLQVVVQEAGFEFADFRAWAIKETFLPADDKSDSFSDIPDDLAKRLLRAKDGMLKGIEQLKGVAA